MRRAARRAILVGALLAVPAAAQAPALPLLDGLEAGRWTLRDRDDPAASRSICLAGGRDLLALDRPAGCRTSIVRSGARELAVHDSCGAAGHRDLVIRGETARLVQIELQGIRRGAPFSTAYEGRRVGACR